MILIEKGQKNQRKKESKQIFISQLQSIGEMPTFYIQDWRTTKRTEDLFPKIKQKRKKQFKQMRSPKCQSVYQSLPRIIPNYIQSEEKPKIYSSLHNLKTYREVLPKLEYQKYQLKTERKQKNIQQKQKYSYLSEPRLRIKNYSSHQDIRNIKDKQRYKVNIQFKNKSQLTINQFKLNTKVSSVLEILKKYQQDSKSTKYGSSRKKIVQILNQNRMDRILRLKINDQSPSLQESIKYFVNTNKN